MLVAEKDAPIKATTRRMASGIRARWFGFRDEVSSVEPSSDEEEEVNWDMGSDMKVSAAPKKRRDHAHGTEKRQALGEATLRRGPYLPPAWLEGAEGRTPGGRGLHAHSVTMEPVLAASSLCFLQSAREVSPANFFSAFAFMS